MAQFLPSKDKVFQTSFLLGSFMPFLFGGNLLQSRSNFYSGMAFKIKTILKRGNKHIRTVLYSSKSESLKSNLQEVDIAR